MILACLGFVVLAVRWALPQPATRRVTSRLAEHAGQPDPVRARPWRWWLAGSGVVAATLLAGVTVGGPPGMVVAAAALVVIGSCLRLLVQHRRLKALLGARVAVAQACTVLAAQVRVGRVPADALAAAAEDCPVLTEARSVYAVGGDVTSAWRVRARLPGYAGLTDLARAWQVSTETGAPLATALDQVSDALTADQALGTVVAGELAAPRATGKIMAALPFCGLGLGYLIGGDPLAFLLAGPVGWGCLVGGVSLAAAGVLWIDHLARQATEQG